MGVEADEESHKVVTSTFTVGPEQVDVLGSISDQKKRSDTYLKNSVNKMRPIGSEDPQNCKVCSQGSLHSGEKKTKKETKANSPETTKNLLSNAQPNTSNTVINSCYLFFSIYFLSTCYRQCINLSYRSMPLLFSCPTVIVIIVIFIFRKQKFV